MNKLLCDITLWMYIMIEEQGNSSSLKSSLKYITKYSNA